MNRPRYQFLPGAVSPTISTFASVRSHDLDVTQDSPQSGAVPDHLLEILFTLDVFVDDYSHAVAVSRRSWTNVIHRNGATFSTAVAIKTGTGRRPCEEFLFIRRASTEPQGFLRVRDHRARRIPAASDPAIAGWPLSRSSRLYPTMFKNASLASGIRLKPPDTSRRW